MDAGPRAADRAPAGRILGRLMHQLGAFAGQLMNQLGRFCMSNYHKQLAPVRHPVTNNSTSWAPGSRPLGRSRWIAGRGSRAFSYIKRARIAGQLARIAGHCAPQLRHASRIAGRWAVSLGQCARAAGGLVLREIQ